MRIGEVSQRFQRATWDNRIPGLMRTSSMLAGPRRRDAGNPAIGHAGPPPQALWQ